MTPKGTVMPMATLSETERMLLANVAVGEDVREVELV